MDITCCRAVPSTQQDAYSMARLLHMWMQHKAESQGTCVNVCHVNAHSDHPWNELADSLARMAATS
eukprot:8204410-Karenia_brevis.AAC.1